MDGVNVGWSTGNWDDADYPVGSHLVPPNTYPSIPDRDWIKTNRDFTVYVDARTSDIAQWYEDRFLALQSGAFTDPRSYFHRYAALSHEEAIAKAREIWREINEPNLVENILPTRARASLVLRKERDHTVSTVLLRKI